MDRTELIDRAEKLVPQLAALARDGELRRRLPDETIELLHEADLFRAIVPTRLGGHGLDFAVISDVGRTLGHADVSTSWVTTFLMMHTWLLAMFPDEVCEEVFGDKGYALAPAALSPIGGTTRCPGGLKVSGRWSWGTGIEHAEWVLVTAVIEDEDMPDLRMVLLSPDQVRVDDVWHTDGMRATGSNDVVVEDVFVPHERTVSFMGLVEGAAANGHDEPILRLPLVSTLCFTAAAPLVGGAEGALEAFTDRLSKRVLAYSLAERQAEKPAAQIRLARAETDIRAAGLLLDDGISRLTSVYEAGDTISRPDRSLFRMAATHAVDLAKRSVNLLCDGAGGSMHFLDEPLQRFQRDLNTGSGHTVFDYDRTAEVRGRICIGLEPGIADML